MEPTTAQVRWLIRRDMPEVLDIDHRAMPFGQRWYEEEWLMRLRQRNCIGMVAEVDYRIVAAMTYELHRSELKLLRLVVHPEDQRCGHGRTMLNRLKEKLTQQRRRRLSTIAREDALGYQLFLQACEFRCGVVLREHFDDWTDGYEFRYDIDDGDNPEPLPPIEICPHCGQAIRRID